MTTTHARPTDPCRLPLASPVGERLRRSPKPIPGLGRIAYADIPLLHRRSPCVPQPPQTTRSPASPPPAAGSPRPTGSFSAPPLLCLSSDSPFTVCLCHPSTAPPVHPVSPPTLLLCRALTPPEHPIVFGRGQGPAQATNPHSNRDRVWTRNP